MVESTLNKSLMLWELVIIFNMTRSLYSFQESVLCYQPIFTNINLRFFYLKLGCLISPRFFYLEISVKHNPTKRPK